MKTLAALVPLCAFALARTAHAQCELAVLEPAPATPIAHVGYSVAIDGNTLLAGAIHEGVSDEGAVHVFERGDAGWVEAPPLLAAEPASGSWFGRAVAVEGDRALVGAPHQTEDGLVYSGAAYVFERVEGIWTQTAKLLPEFPQEGALFGTSVALAGGTALVGTLEGGTTTDGSVYVFEPGEVEWAQVQRLVPALRRPGAWFGFDLAVSGDALLVGAPSVDSPTNRGRAFVFERSAGVWSERALLLPPASFEGRMFGRDVALDGARMLISANGPGASPGEPGRAFVFERESSAWTLVNELVPHDAGASDLFVGAVALRGERALVCTPFDQQGSAIHAGSAWLYTRGPGGWEERGKLADPSPSVTQYCGLAAALAADGTAVIGIPFDREKRGSVLVWRTSLAGCATLAGIPERVSVTQGGVQELLLDSPAGAADQFFLVLGSERGTSPGLRLRSELLLPLNPGSILYLSGQFPNAPPFGNTLGRLDAQGTAVATITIPRFTDPALIGLRLHFAYLSGDAESALPPRGASNAVPLELVP